MRLGIAPGVAFAIVLSTVSADAARYQQYPRLRSAPRVSRPALATASVAPAPKINIGANLVVNGSFEANGGENTAVFTGWNVVQAGDGNWWAQTGTSAPVSGLSVQAPTDGTFAAMTGQGGPGMNLLYQDVTLPSGSTIQLSFDLYLQNANGTFFTPDSLSYDGEPNQQFRMDVVDPLAAPDALGPAVLLNVYRTEVGDPATSPYTQVTADLSAFAGQTVRFRFAQVDNQFFFAAGVDNVVLTAESTTATTPMSLNFEIYNQGRAGSLQSQVSAWLSDVSTAHPLGTGRDEPLELTLVSPAAECGGPSTNPCTPARNPGASASYAATFEATTGGFGRHVIPDGPNQAGEEVDGTFTLTSGALVKSAVSFVYGRYLWVEADSARDLEGEKLDQSLQVLPSLLANDAQVIEVPGQAATFGALSFLRATFETLSGGSVAGSPRLEVHLVGHGKIGMRLGSGSPWVDADASSGVNLIGDTTADRFDTSELTGVDESAQDEFTTYGAALAAAGSFTISRVDFVVDATDETRTYTLTSIELGTPNP